MDCSQEARLLTNIRRIFYPPQRPKRSVLLFVAANSSIFKAFSARTISCITDIERTGNVRLRIKYSRGIRLEI